MMQEYCSSYCSSNSEEAKGVKHASWLHSVKKSIAKPCKKAPVAPMPPTPIQVYKVDPRNFRYLVQQLTGAPEFKPRQLQNVAPITVSSFVDAQSRDVATAASPTFSWAPKAPMSNLYLQDVQSEAIGMGVNYQENASPGPLELNLSSPSYNWCSSFPPMSPGTLTSLEQGRVL